MFLNWWNDCDIVRLSDWNFNTEKKYGVLISELIQVNPKTKELCSESAYRTRIALIWIHLIERHILHYHRDGLQDERQEEVNVDVVPRTVEFPGHHKTIMSHLTPIYLSSILPAL